jgi:hypothetical protein
MEFSSLISMSEKAQLIVEVSVPGEVAYQCSLCGRVFPLPANPAPKEAMGKIWAEFKDHIRTSHSEHVDSSEQPTGGNHKP